LAFDYMAEGTAIRNTGEGDAKYDAFVAGDDANTAGYGDAKMAQASANIEEAYAKMAAADGKKSGAGTGSATRVPTTGADAMTVRGLERERGSFSSPPPAERGAFSSPFPASFSSPPPAAMKEWRSSFGSVLAGGSLRGVAVKAEDEEQSEELRLPPTVLPSVLRSPPTTGGAPRRLSHGSHTTLTQH
jgi:hypothetical protein